MLSRGIKNFQDSLVIELSSFTICFSTGLFLASHSIIFGVETAKGFRWLIRRLKANGKHGIVRSSGNWKIDSFRRHLAVIVVGMLMLGLLYSLSGILEKRDFKSGIGEAALWLGCMVAPLGVWIRWWLARFNGRGLGKAGSFKWVPFGTLIANVSSASVMAALSTLKKAVRFFKVIDIHSILPSLSLNFVVCDRMCKFAFEYDSDHNLASLVMEWKFSHWG